jgi:hypothetical protein
MLLEEFVNRFALKSILMDKMGSGACLSPLINDVGPVP